MNLYSYKALREQIITPAVVGVVMFTTALHYILEKNEMFLVIEMNVNYKKLEIWNLAYEFVLNVYRAVDTFPRYEENNMTSQLRRAATCLPLNIAEGSGARSPRIFLNYLIFAYRSGREIEALLMLSKALTYLGEKEFEKLSADLDLFIRKLSAYMNYLENDVIRNKRKKDLTHFYRQNKPRELGALA